jgi:endonuclease-3 related protein
MPASIRRRLLAVYRRLRDHFGPQHWWPAESPFEMMVGAILTQNTAWRNVEAAIANLKAAGRLSPRGIREAPPAELAALIRPSGYFNLKTKRLQAFVTWFDEEHGADPRALAAAPLATIRPALLEVYGIGPETADSILLYAAGRPTFVVDAYTQRIFARLDLVPDDATYEGTRRLCLEHLPAEVGLCNEYHALLVALGKAYCRPRRAPCARCPLRGLHHRRYAETD